jgi:hypothetical protein
MRSGEPSEGSAAAWLTLTLPSLSLWVLPLPQPGEGIYFPFSMFQNTWIGPSTTPVKLVR